MASFEATIEAQLDGAAVRAAHLVRFGFLSGEVRVWTGFGDLIANGETWSGVGNLGALSTVNVGSSGAVEEMTFALAGTAEMLAAIADDAAESSGREVTVYLQFFDVRSFDDAGNWVEWQPLDDPLTLFWGIMGPLTIARPRPDGADAQAVRTISVSAASALFNRARPAYAYMTDVDQKARHPGDEIFRNMQSFVDKEARWPHF